MSNIHNPDRTGSTPPGSTINITWDNVALYTGNDQTWQDVNGGVGEAVLILRVNGSSAATSSVFVRKRGVSTTDVTGTAKGQVGNVEQLSYLIVPTDPSGYIQVKSSINMTTVTLTRIGYWRCPMPRNVWTGASSPAAYADINLGVKNALTFLRCYTTEAASRAIRFRTKGDATAEQQYGYDSASWAAFSSTIDGYVAVLTNASGVAEFYTPVQGQYSICLEGYVPVADMVSEVIFATAAIPGAWQDLVTVYGRSLLYVKGVGSADGAVKSRINGETLEVNDACYGIGYIPVQNNKHGYGLWVMDYAGTIEWMDAGAGVNITLTKQAKLT